MLTGNTHVLSSLPSLSNMYVMQNAVVRYQLADPMKVTIGICAKSNTYN